MKTFTLEWHRIAAFAGLLLAPVAYTSAAQAIRTGTIAQTYAESCAGCHGQNLEGGKAASMLDDVWVYGGDDESLSKSIRNGMPDKGMPAWSATLPEKEIRAMVVFIRERRVEYERDHTVFAKPTKGASVQTALHSYRLDPWVSEFDQPWSLAFLPEGKAILTEKSGKCFVIDNGKRRHREVKNMPIIDYFGEGGLFDVILHPDYATNGWIYFAFTDLQTDASRKEVSMTRIIRGRLRDNTFVDQETIFKAPLTHYQERGGEHFGGRMTFDDKGFLYFTTGERGVSQLAQDLTSTLGKIHRVHDDGRIPEDNPFSQDATADRTIWTYGHRNCQGIAFEKATQQLFVSEHGPRGGDELNLILKGRNYGWPVISYGINYDGTTLTELTSKEGMEQPLVYWTPSIAPCGINFYTGDLFPKWKGHLLVASLVGEDLRRLEIVDGKVVAQEILLKNFGRIRHVITGPDGALYLLFPTYVARMTPTS